MSQTAKTTRHRDGGLLRQLQLWREEVRRGLEAEAKARRKAEERLKAAEAELKALKKEHDERIIRLASRIHRMEGEIWNLPTEIPILRPEEGW